MRDALSNPNHPMKLFEMIAGREQSAQQPAATVSRMLMASLSWFAACNAVAAPLRITSLHPIISDLARQVGGDEVIVQDLMPSGSNPHIFYPTQADLKKASDADLVLASGKGMETYIDEFAESLGGGVDVFDVGRTVPSLKIEVDEVFVCCPSHARGAVDPHWWHSIQNVRRASLALAGEFARRRPDKADYFRERGETYAQSLNELYAWAKKEVRSIPLADRELTTAHAAFGYLCRELGLRSITVLGLTDEHDADPDHLKDVIQTLRRENVRAVFPEDGANPKILDTIAREADVRIGGMLHGDMMGGHDSSYVSFMRCNISTIVEGLGSAE